MSLEQQHHDSHHGHDSQHHDSQGFITVPIRKKKRKNRPYPITELSFSERLNEAAVEIEGTGWIRQCCDIIQKCFDSLGWTPPEISVFCLGLGSPTASKSSVAQLAFITSICDTLHIDRSKVSFFDPHFSEKDIRGLLEMRYIHSSENKRGRYTFSQKTLLFMPHCNVKLYENILRSNWDLEALPRTLILGNNLGDYIISAPEWKLKTTMPCLSRIAPYLICDPLPDSENHYSAFNNTVLQHVERRSLLLLEEQIWKLPDEVEDDGAEIV